MTKAIILDTETTDASDECEYIEVAYLSLQTNRFDEIIRSQGTPHKFAVSCEFRKRYKPSKDIQLGALAVHHIHRDDLKDCEPTGSFSIGKDVEYIIGHNIDFDWKAIKCPDVRRIDTLPLARLFMPQLDSHTQSALLYHILGKSARPILRDAHSALADVKICLTILEHIIDLYLPDVTIETLWEESESARVPIIMPFGKHKGEKIKEDVPYGYKTWLLNQPDVDPYLQIALRK